ncbi:MAG: Carboxy-terminal processing protease CtpA precursor [Microgenomates group bacterium ADurb.Bin219]|nr:MAG: Carboxy-terminal processing protease CtpA precursor [Microgenomates group bacterium ADurb.Bin219]HNP89333.1 S41 family peptidase [Candidatus Woesebacteria bacterium]
MKLNLRQVRLIILFAIFGLFCGAAGYWFGQREISFSSVNSSLKVKIDRKAQPKNQDVDFGLFWEVWDRISTSYLQRKTLDQGKMIYGAISGMVNSLGDAYTVFLPPPENKQTKEDLNGSFEGVGIQLGYKEERLAVVAPLAGMPAELAGIKAGDLILRIIDESKKVDKDTTGMSLPEAVSLIRGPRGSVVKLTFSREGKEKPFEVPLKRETIVVKSVELAFLEKEGTTVAHLQLTRFGDRTETEWQEAVTKINEKCNTSKDKCAGVILDLRNNPGGYLTGSVYIASEFLSQGVVVQQDKGEEGKETYSVNRQGQLLSQPLVVLINGGSASASEIVAGALQETKRAKLVGEKSFGKGTIQEAQDLFGGAGLHVTIARWLLPSGKSIDKEGVIPDFEVKMDEKDETRDPQLDKAVELLINKI